MNTVYFSHNGLQEVGVTHPTSFQQKETQQNISGNMAGKGWGLTSLAIWRSLNRLYQDARDVLYSPSPSHPYPLIRHCHKVNGNFPKCFLPNGLSPILSVSVQVEYGTKSDRSSFTWKKYVVPSQSLLLSHPP